MSEGREFVCTEQHLVAVSYHCIEYNSSDQISLYSGGASRTAAWISNRLCVCVWAGHPHVCARGGLVCMCVSHHQHTICQKFRTKESDYKEG